MLKLEQLRAEILDRFERVDRRFAQQDQRLGRIDQRTYDTAERIEAIRVELIDRLDSVSAAERDRDAEYGAAVAPSEHQL